MEGKRDRHSPILTIFLLGYVIGATMTFSKAMPSERVADVVDQTLIMARAMAVSLTWPLYWGWQLFNS